VNTGLAVAAALGSAFCFSVSSALQQRCAFHAPRDSKTGLVLHLLAHPIWLIGLLAATGTVALQAVALAAGQLVLVQPLLVLGLLFALPLSVLLEARRPSLSEWCWAATLVVGLAVFLRAAHPATGPLLPDRGKLLVTCAGVVLLALALVGFAYGTRTRHRACLLGLATGLAYGTTAALLKYSFALAHGDWARMLTSWPTYALVVVGLAGILLNQLAYQAGPLAGALPPLTVADPAAAVVFGVVAFSEGLSTTSVAICFQAIGAALVTVAIVQLARRSATRAPAPERETRVAPVAVAAAPAL
jgi:drug/metabolite transporter (DMT)-like permease